MSKNILITLDGNPLYDVTPLVVKLALRLSEAKVAGIGYYTISDPILPETVKVIMDDQSYPTERYELRIKDRMSAGYDALKEVDDNHGRTIVVSDGSWIDNLALAPVYANGKICEGSMYIKSYKEEGDLPVQYLWGDLLDTMNKRYKLGVEIYIIIIPDDEWINEKVLLAKDDVEKDYLIHLVKRYLYIARELGIPMIRIASNDSDGEIMAALEMVVKRGIGKGFTELLSNLKV